MSITIDDMKMPKSCIVCPFEHNGDCYGGKPKRIMDIEDFNYYRHPNCPLKEIVRCKDCKFFKTYPPTEEQDYTIYDCKRLIDCTDNAVGNLPDDFCSRGERRARNEENSIKNYSAFYGDGTTPNFIVEL